HDIRRSTFRQSVRELRERSNIFEAELTEACAPELNQWSENVCPGTVLNSGPTITRLAELPEASAFETPRAALAQIQADLNGFREQYKLAQVVVINVAS